MFQRHRSLVLISVFVLIGLVSGCSAPILSSGVVIEKRHEPESTVLIMVPIQTGKTTMMIPMYIHDDEDWIVRIEGVWDGEVVQNTLYLPREYWELVEVGDVLQVPEGTEYDDPEERERAER
jgi:hypothetical protein